MGFLKRFRRQFNKTEKAIPKPVICKECGQTIGYEVDKKYVINNYGTVSKTTGTNI